MRLIDVDALIDKHCEGCNEDVRGICKTDPVCATLMWFEEAPTVDAVEVVRCKDCKYFEFAHDCNFHAADENGTPIFVREDDFCSYGERKEGAE